ncbi:hypothetical protein V8F06_002349 [Rhypophila decipiens]
MISVSLTVTLDLMVKYRYLSLTGQTISHAEFCFHSSLFGTSNCVPSRTSWRAHSLFCHPCWTFYKDIRHIHDFSAMPLPFLGSPNLHGELSRSSSQTFQLRARYYNRFDFPQLPVVPRTNSVVGNSHAVVLWFHTSRPWHANRAPSIRSRGHQRLQRAFQRIHKTIVGNSYPRTKVESCSGLFLPAFHACSHSGMPCGCVSLMQMYHPLFLLGWQAMCDLNNNSYWTAADGG